MRVELAEIDYPEFIEEGTKRNYRQLAKPMPKYDPEVVLEFYMNAWPTKEGVHDKRSKRCDRPIFRKSIDLGRNTTMRHRATGFDEDAIGHLLCFPGQDFVHSMVGKRLWIMRIHMTIITHIWMTFLLSSILSSDHNYNLTLPKCQLVYNFIEHISVNVAQLISNAFHQFVIVEPPRHP
ncbi:hypothetical protein GmHk_01G001466 [Glycine max]|nr:hypothetical protein GmHk_01G001466 [Glycine max]